MERKWLPPQLRTHDKSPIVFDGSTPQLVPATVIAGGTNELTVKTRLKFSYAYGNQWILMGTNYANWVDIYISDNMLVFDKPDVVGLTFPWTPTVWQYYDLEFVADGSWMKIKVDWTIVASNGNTLNFNSTTSQIGIWGYVKNWVVQAWWNMQWTIDSITITQWGTEVDLFEYLRKIAFHFQGDVSGTTIFDGSWNGNHGTLVNSPISTRGWLCGYEWLKFNGTDQYVTVPSNADTVIGTSDFTFSVTAKFDNITSARCLVSKMNEYYNGSTVATWIAFGIWDVGYSNWSFGFATWEWNANTWVNGAYNEYYGLKVWVPARVSCVRRWTSHEVWLNWVMVLSNTGPVRNVTNPYPLNLWRYNWAYDQYFQGVMSNPVFELRAFSKEEMQLDALAFFIP